MAMRKEEDTIPEIDLLPPIVTATTVTQTATRPTVTATNVVTDTTNVDDIDEATATTTNQPTVIPPIG